MWYVTRGLNINLHTGVGLDSVKLSLGACRNPELPEEPSKKINFLKTFWFVDSRLANIIGRFFIVAWITYIYVWQRFERYFSHHRANFRVKTIYIGKRSIHFA